MDVDDGTGYLYVDVSRDSSEDIVFKSAPVAEPVLSLKIYDAENRVVASFANWKELQGKTLPLKIGSYTAVASSATSSQTADQTPVIPDAVFDAPFYSGEKKFNVTSESVTNIDISCTLANVKVTAAFSQEIKDNFTSYELTVTNGFGSLKFSNLTGTDSKEGYFRCTGSLTWTIDLVNKDGKKYKSLTETYDNVKPKQHYNLTFNVDKKEDFGGGALTVIVDNSLTEKKYDLTLDFGEVSAPSIAPDFQYTDGVPVEINAGDMTSRKFVLSSAIGFRNLLFTYEGKTVDLVGAAPEAIDGLSALGIKTALVNEGGNSAEIDITEYISKQPIGSVDVSVLASDLNGAYSRTDVNFVMRSPVGTEAVSADAWAMFATLKGKWFPELKPEGIEVLYKKTSDQGWTSVTESSLKIDDASRTFSVEVANLVPNTEYQFKTTMADDKAAGKESKVITFMTEGTPVLPNMSFDAWTMGSTGWFPNATDNEASPDFIWDSANTKVMVVQIEVTTPEESHLAVSGSGKKAAKLSSIVKAGKFAAGNIYTGNFGEATMNPMGAKLKWGVPFTGRPLALKGSYDYRPVNITHADASHAHLKGQMDVGQVQVMLTTWKAPFDIDTAKNIFVDVNAPEVIAYGTLDLNATSGYQQFEIKLDYRDTTQKPAYIVIVGAASKYGDFFTGGQGSVLYLDELSFEYDKTQLSK